jgi:inositol oxygenase
MVSFYDSNYVNSDRQEIVLNHYKLMRSFQTVEFYDKMISKYSFETPRALMSIQEAFVALENYVDSSDPDVDIPNIVHMFQTAEGIRKAGHPDWMQLVGLIHDMGKIMYLWGTDEDGQNGTATGAQWALGGDTWVLGARIPDCTVLPQFNQLNPDMADSRYNSELGIYEPNCGLSALKFAYGHDEYLFHMVIANKTLIPPEGLAMIRFHSLYPWHTGGAYRQFMNDHDKEMLDWYSFLPTLSSLIHSLSVGCWSSTSTISTRKTVQESKLKTSLHFGNTMPLSWRSITSLDN